MNNIVYGSFADYTDEDAERDAQKMIEEHNHNFDSKKSENNYLSKLSVTGGILSPNFDRQTLDYSLKIENNINEIDIVAVADDKQAKVNGSGKIDISNTSECKVEVIADSGTVRTYNIKIIKDGEANQNISIEDLIQEVAYQNSRKNKYTDKQRRRFILDNYFKGNNSITKFPSKHKMEKALKNINYEMEKASQEFSKLFNYDEKSK